MGFSDKLRLCNLLVDDIRPYREFSIKAPRKCSFSNGGKYFAAVNGPVIQVYNMYTCENVGNCRGHGGKVTGIAFSSDDKRLLSTGLDGAVYEWSLSTFQREKENVIKSNEYASVAVAPDDTYVFAVGSDATLKQLDGEDLMLNEELASLGLVAAKPRPGQRPSRRRPSPAAAGDIPGGVQGIGSRVRFGRPGRQRGQGVQGVSVPRGSGDGNAGQRRYPALLRRTVLSVFDVKERAMEGAAKAGGGWCLLRRCS